MKLLNRQLPLLILLCGSIATGWTSWNISRQIELEARRNFDEHSTYFKGAIQRRLLAYEDILFGLAGLYNTETMVSEREFLSYAKSLELETRAPAIDAVNYAEYFTAVERDRFIARFRSEAQARGRHPAPLLLPDDADEYMVITRVYPEGAMGMGVNTFFNPRRYSDGNLLNVVPSSHFKPRAPFSSGLPIRPPGTNYTAMALRLGVFRPDEDGRPELKGSVGLGFNVEQFFHEALPPLLLRSSTYRVENIGRAGEESYPKPVPIFSSELTTAMPANMEKNPAHVYATSFILPFGGALLRFEMRQAKSEIVSMRDMVLPYAVLFTGLAIFGMAAALVRKIQIYNVDLRREIAAQTAKLREEIERSKLLEKELTHAAEKERRRVGYELHDELGQRLTGISLAARALAESLRPEAQGLSRYAEALERDTSEAIASVRGLAHGLMPVPPGRHGLREALEQFAISVSSRAVRCVFDFDDPVDVEDREVATNLYRIAQEAVNNAIRHGRATLVTITLDEEGGKVALTVADNGKGFPRQHVDGEIDALAPQVAGAGLRIMAHRASVIGFRLTVASSAAGTTIRALQC